MIFQAYPHQAPPSRPTHFQTTLHTRFYLHFQTPYLVPRLAREVFGPSVQSPECMGQASIL